jgi:cytochrome P450
MGSVLGLDDVEATTLLAWYAAIVGAVTALTAGREPGPDAARAVTELGERVRAAGVCPTGDLTPEEVTSYAAVVMFGGVETVEGVICNAVALVLSRPEVADAVAAEAGLAAAAVEESLRLEPAASVVDRYSTADVTLAGVAIARGDLVRVSLAGANRDPEVFADPDTYDPGRPNLRAQLSFARGAHTCVAMELARLGARVALRAVLDLPGARLDGPVEVGGLVFRKPAALPVAWAP